MRRRTVSRGTRGPKRQLVWARSNNLPGGSAITAVAARANLLTDYQTQAGGDTLAGATIMAVRGRIWIARDTAAAVPSTLTWGLIVGPELLTSSADYGPAINGRYLDWFYRDYVLNPAGTQLPPAQTSVDYAPVNVRSRRKIKELGETLYLCYEAPTAAVVQQTLWYALDVLLALP